MHLKHRQDLAQESSAKSGILPYLDLVLHRGHAVGLSRDRDRGVGSFLAFDVSAQNHHTVSDGVDMDIRQTAHLVRRQLGLDLGCDEGVLDERGGMRTV
jgi:hypothetical protein